MSTPWMYVSGAIILLGLGYILVRGIRSYFRFRGTRLVICPETTLTAAVKVNALGMAEDTILGTPHLELQTCTRWPERKGCGQACLSQIEEAPEECLVKNIVAKWYATRKCVYCGKPFDNVEDIFHHKPAMLDQDGKSVEWDALPPEALPNNFVNCRPVCWSCHMIETFRREHPDSILNNPWQPRHEGGPVETHHAPAAKPH